MITLLAWYLGVILVATLIYRAAYRGIPRQKVIMRKPREIDTRIYVGNRPIEPTDTDGTGALTHPGDQRSPYDACGCIAPCPDHKSPAQDGRRDRAYWNDHHYPSEESE